MDFLKLENHIFSTFTIICFNSRVAPIDGLGEDPQGHKWKSTLDRELWALNGKEMTLDHKWNSTPGGELWALNEKEITLGHKWKSTLGRELWVVDGKEMALCHEWKFTLGREL